jgi:hypothetical protein
MIICSSSVTKADIRRLKKRHMLRREAIFALRAYTRLPENVQGILERRGDEYEFGSGIVRSDSFDRAITSIDADVFCVSKLRIMSGGSEVAGTVDGSFVLRGKAIKLEHSMLAIVAVVAGNVPEDLRSASNVYLISLHDEDFMRCSVPQQLPFGVNVVTDALAPRWNYISAIFSKQIQHALVACPNGIFAMRSSVMPSMLSPSKAEALLKNLVELDVVIEVEAPKPKTIYRVASNCIFVGGDRMQAQVAALQRSLQIPGYMEAVKTLPTSLSYYSIDASLLQMEGPGVSFEAARNNAPSGASVRKESLSKWWEAPASFKLRVSITNPANQETPIDMHMNIKEGASKEFDISIDVKALPFRETRPGETETMMRNQLQAVFSSSVASALSDFSIKDVDQSHVDKLTRSLGETIGSNVNLAMLFNGAVTVSVKMTLDQADGETTHLPSGDVVVIPKYSFESESARLNAYLGVFSALGLQGSFSGWNQAIRNRVMVI